MRDIFGSLTSFRYLDKQAESLLDYAKKNFLSYSLNEKFLTDMGDGVVIFPWAGSAMITAFSHIF